MSILRSIGRYYRNKMIRKGIGGIIKGATKMAATTAILSIVAIPAIKTEQGTAIAMEFKSSVTSKFEEIKEDACNLFVKDVTDTVNDADYSTNEGVQNMANNVAGLSETFSNENGVEFSKASVSRVVDGDTIVVDIYGDNCGDKSHEYTVRLIGVNTPESVAPEEYLEYKGTTNSVEGKQASEWLSDYLEDEDYVYLEQDTSDIDKYGRLLRYVWLEVPDNELDIDVVSNEMLNGILVKEGYAEVATYKPDVKYADYFAAIEARTTDDFAIDR